MDAKIAEIISEEWERKADLDRDAFLSEIGWKIESWCDSPIEKLMAAHLATIETPANPYFHDRTPEQAQRDRKRDRWIQSQGLRVFRFTGREIHHRGAECAREVEKYLDKLMSEYWYGDLGMGG